MVGDGGIELPFFFHDLECRVPGDPFLAFRALGDADGAFHADDRSAFSVEVSGWLILKEEMVKPS